MKPLFRALSLALALSNPLAATAVEEGFVSIFDGKSLDGWEGNPAIWSVQDGALTGQTKADTNLRHNTFLVWKGGSVEDFELRLSYRIVKGNSGIQYRSKVIEQGPQGPIVGGYQADFEAGTTYSGILYEERGRGILAQRGQKVTVRAADGGKHKVDVTGSVGESKDIQAAIRSEQWNDYVITAQGNHLVHTINGHTTVDVTDEDAAHAAKSGILALQVHVGPPMTVQFKDVRIRKGSAQAAVSDQDRIQGEWVGASGLWKGQPVPQQWVSGLSLKIKGQKYEVSRNDGGDSGTLKLKPGTPAGQMDITSDAKGLIEGLYELKGDRLTVSYATDGSPRPTSLKSTPDSTAIVITYRRK